MDSRGDPPKFSHAATTKSIFNNGGSGTSLSTDFRDRNINTASNGTKKSNIKSSML